jgi:3',5'-cyclic AMP phosphodiesterase CpdA
MGNRRGAEPFRSGLAIRILHLSDIHFTCENREATAAAADYVRRTPFDLLVASGDITQWGKREEFAAARAWFQTLPGPKLMTPGNHDTPWFGLIERVVSPFGRYEKTLGPSAADGFDKPGLRVRAMNSARGWQVRINWSKGHVSRAQARATAGELAAAPAGDFRILICHHPLLEEPGEPITSEVRGGHRAARAMTAAGVDAVLTGHLHVPFVHPYPYGDGQTYAVGAGTLSQRERGARPSFNVVELDGTAMKVTALEWDGTALSTLREWTVSLRPRP